MKDEITDSMKDEIVDREYLFDPRKVTKQFEQENNILIRKPLAIPILLILMLYQQEYLNHKYKILNN